mgnify:CR=1 FL=1
MSDLSISLAALERSRTQLSAASYFHEDVFSDERALIFDPGPRYAGHELAFALGAMAASFCFFFSLGYGARLLAPLFARPVAWRVLDGVIALVMASIAIKLLL